MRLLLSACHCTIYYCIQTIRFFICGIVIGVTLSMLKLPTNIISMLKYHAIILTKNKGRETLAYCIHERKIYLNI